MEQIPNKIEIGHSRSYAELKRQLFDRTRFSFLTESANPTNSNLREIAQQWSQKRFFGFVLKEIETTKWFNLWLEYSTIHDDEFMVYWPLSDKAISNGKDRILLTNKRLVVFTTEKSSLIKREFLLSDVAKYKVVESCKLYDVTIETRSGDHLEILRLSNFPSEERVSALLD
jgi:hypothetical protein